MESSMLLVAILHARIHLRGDVPSCSSCQLFVGGDVPRRSRRVRVCLLYICSFGVFQISTYSKGKSTCRALSSSEKRRARL